MRWLELFGKGAVVETLTAAPVVVNSSAASALIPFKTSARVFPPSIPNCWGHWHQLSSGKKIITKYELLSIEATGATAQCQIGFGPCGTEIIMALLTVGSSCGIITIPIPDIPAGTRICARLMASDTEARIITLRTHLTTWPTWPATTILLRPSRGKEQ